MSPPDSMWFATPQTDLLLWARLKFGLYLVTLAERLLGYELWPMDETLRRYYNAFGIPRRGASVMPHERGGNPRTNCETCGSYCGQCGTSDLVFYDGIPNRETDPHGWRG